MKTWLIFCFLSTYLYAEDLDKYFAMSLDDLLNVEVTTTSKYAENLQDSPANIYIISRKQILERGYRHIGDVIQSLPGVDIQKYALRNSPISATFRGNAGNNKFLILQDGVRLSSVGGELSNITMNFPIYYAKQIEVLMGPSSVNYGADAFMGVINIISLDKDDIEVKLSLGEDEYGYAHAYLSQNLENGLHFSLGAQAYQGQELHFSEDFPELYAPSTVSATGNPLLFPQSKTQTIFSNLKTQEHWEFGFNYAKMEASNYYGSQPTRNAFDTDAIAETTTATLFAKYNTSLSKNLHSSSLLTLMYYELGNSTYFNNIFTNFVPLYKYSQTKRVSFNQDFIYDFNDAHKISFGGVFDKIDSIPVGADLPSPYNTSESPSNQNLFYPGTTLPIVFFENNHKNYGGYIQDNWKINEQWRLVSGIRYDKDSFYGESTNPRISTIYQPNETNLFKLLYGQAFLAPSSDISFKNFGSFSGFNAGTGLWESNFFQAPNPDLSPEKLQTIELTYEHWFATHTHLKFAPYYTHIDDVIRLSADSTPNQFIPGADIGFTKSNKNTGKMNIYGADISLEDTSRFDNLEINSWGSFSYVNGRLEENAVKTELPLVSEYKFKAGASLIYNETYTLSPQFYWIGKSNNNEADKDEPTRRYHVPSYFLTDLHLEAKLTNKLSIISDIYNLFDKKYTNAIYTSQSSSLPAAPQPGRLITGSLYYKF